MTGTGSTALAATLFAVAGAVVLLAVAWERAPTVVRVGLALVAVISVGAAAILQLNRLSKALSPVGADPVINGSHVMAVRVAGHASGLTLPLYVYLPAAYRTGQTRFPVIEALHGDPGTPLDWLTALDAQSYLDWELAAGRMAPTVVLFPGRAPQEQPDTCADPQTETFLTIDVADYARQHFRVRTDRDAWGLIGYSSGGFCAVTLALRHPGRYAAAASLSGFAGPSPVPSLPPQSTALWLGWAADDERSGADSRGMAAGAHPPLAVSTAVVEQGGNSAAAWRLMEPPAFDWLSAHLAPPVR